MFEGRLISLETQDIELEDGTRSYREIVRHPGAVAILAQRPDGRFLFVTQYRKAVEKEMLEMVAGTLEPGEEEEPAARRELLEETGYAAKRLTRLGTLFPSPGYVDERIAIFLADTEDQAGAMTPDEDERIELVPLTRKEITEAIFRNDITDAKTLGTWAMFLCREESRT